MWNACPMFILGIGIKGILRTERQYCQNCWGKEACLYIVYVFSPVSVYFVIGGWIPGIELGALCMLGKQPPNWAISLVQISTSQLTVTCLDCRVRWVMAMTLSCPCFLVDTIILEWGGWRDGSGVKSTALPEVRSSISSNHMVAHNHLW